MLASYKPRTAAAVLVLHAVAVFCLAILSEPNRIVEKFTLFAAMHWAAVVLCGLVYVFLSYRGHKMAEGSKKWAEGPIF